MCVITLLNGLPRMGIIFQADSSSFKILVVLCVHTVHKMHNAPNVLAFQARVAQKKVKKVKQKMLLQHQHGNMLLPPSLLFFTLLKF